MYTQIYSHLGMFGASIQAERSDVGKICWGPRSLMSGQHVRGNKSLWANMGIERWSGLEALFNDHLILSHNYSEFVSALTRDWLFTVWSIELYVTPKWLWRLICTPCLFHPRVSCKGPSFCFLLVFILIHFCYCVEVIFEFFPRKGTHVDFLRIVKYLKVTLLFFYEVEFVWV